MGLKGLFVKLGNSITEENIYFQDIDAADVNGDGVLDLLLSGQTKTGSNESLFSVALGKTANGISPLLEFSLKTTADARQAIGIFENKRETLLAQRAEIGANQSRIEVARNVLQVAAENFQAAESRIRDADIAAESASLTRLQILQQAQTAILGQANQQPVLALSLL